MRRNVPVGTGRPKTRVTEACGTQLEAGWATRDRLRMYQLLQFTRYPVAANGLLFLAGAALIWWAGARLALFADVIAERTGFGRGFVGALLLGGATSLPEIATALTASILGNAALAVNNLLGGVAMQIAVLALIDFWLVRGALTFFSPKPVVLLGGVLLIAQISLAIAGVFAGEPISFYGLGLWPLLFVGGYLASLYFMQRYEGNERWLPADFPDQWHEDDISPATSLRGAERFSGLQKSPESGNPSAEPSNAEDTSVFMPRAEATGNLYLRFAAFSLVVLAAGWLVANTADALSVQLGLGSGFVGATFVALTTSLPEISTTAGAVRIGSYTLAFSNIFGTNSLEVALLSVTDVAYRQGPIIDAVHRAAGFIGAIGILMTAIYLWGLLERRNKTLLRMGIDSLIVALIYVGGLLVMYSVSSDPAASSGLR